VESPSDERSPVKIRRYQLSIIWHTVCQDLLMMRRDSSQEDLDELRAAIGQARRLLPILSDLMASQPGDGPNHSPISRNKPESKEPWAHEAAHCYWMIFYGSQKLADQMRIRAGVSTQRWRHGEDGLEVINACAIIIEPQMLGYARRLVQNWVAAALEIRDLDHVDDWTAVPRVPGTRPPFCPYCHTPALRLNRLLGEVKCLYPGCADSDGNPTRARMEYNSATGAGILVFTDHSIMTFTPAA
jgi:hypothetical protein